MDGAEPAPVPGRRATMNHLLAVPMSYLLSRLAAPHPAARADGNARASERSQHVSFAVALAVFVRAEPVCRSSTQLVTGRRLLGSSWSQTVSPRSCCY